MQAGEDEWTVTERNPDSAVPRRIRRLRIPSGRNAHRSRRIDFVAREQVIGNRFLTVFGYQVWWVVSRMSFFRLSDKWRQDPSCCDTMLVVTTGRLGEHSPWPSTLCGGVERGYLPGPRIGIRADTKANWLRCGLRGLSPVPKLSGRQ